MQSNDVKIFTWGFWSFRCKFFRNQLMMYIFNRRIFFSLPTILFFYFSKEDTPSLQCEWHKNPLRDDWHCNISWSPTVFCTYSFASTLKTFISISLIAEMKRKYFFYYRNIIFSNYYHHFCRIIIKSTRWKIVIIIIFMLYSFNNIKYNFNNFMKVKKKNFYQKMKRDY